MPKRSLNPGRGEPKKIEHLNQAVERMLSRTDGKSGKVEAAVEPLVRIAAQLRDLPRESFKARLRSEFEGRKNMSAIAERIHAESSVSQPVVAESVAAVRTSAAPRLTFNDAAKAIEFYTKALGAKEIFRFEVEGHIPHAEIRIGDSAIMVTEEWPEGGRFSAETLGNSPVLMTIQVPDVDAFAERAVAAGMKVILPLKDQFYGHRDVTLADPFGYRWTAITVKEEMSLEEMHRRMPAGMTGPERAPMPAESARQSGVKPVPEGFRMVTPYLVAADGVAELEFVKAAFGAEETLRAMTGTGVHGEVHIGDSALMIGGGVAGVKFPATLHSQALHVYVKDADAVYKKALAAGAVSVDEPRDQEYGERSATVKDAAGNVWYIATNIPKKQGEGYVATGLHNVNPYLHPLRAEPLIAFLTRAFGAQELAKYANPDGVVRHAVIRMGDSVVEMGEAQGKYERMPAMFYLYVPDCDAQYRRALAAGATTLHEPKDQPYGDRSSAVTDGFGNIWYIATHVKDVQM